MLTLHISQHLIMSYLVQNMDTSPRSLQPPPKDPPKEKFPLSYEDMERRIRMLDENDEELRRAGRMVNARAKQRRAEQASAPRLESPDIEPRLEVRAASPPLAQEHVQAQAQAHPQV